MSSIYDAITQCVIAKLESGVVPWTKPWHGQAGIPRNLVSKKPYRGINVFMLHCLAYESPYFLTFKQAKDLGGHVRRGERGCPVVFWKWLDVDDEDGEQHRVPVARQYTVFNVAQTEGIEAPKLEVVERVHSPIQEAERIVQGMQNAPEIQHGHTGASYSPTEDLVRMPRPEIFETGQRYYACAGEIARPSRSRCVTNSMMSGGVGHRFVSG